MKKSALYTRKLGVCGGCWLFSSNPSLSANKLKLSALRWAFFVHVRQELAPVRTCTKKAQKAVRPLSFNLFRYVPPQAVRDVTHAVRQIPIQ